MTSRGSNKSLVGFVVGGVAYALGIDGVQELLSPLPVVPTPHAPPDVIGVADVRGEVIPVLDLRLRFGVELPQTTRKTKWLVLVVRGIAFALVVDDVTGVFAHSGELRPPPPVAAGRATGIVGVTTEEERLVFVLEPASLLAFSPAVTPAPPPFRPGAPAPSPLPPSHAPSQAPPSMRAFSADDDIPAVLGTFARPRS